MKLKIPQTATLRDRACDVYAVEVTSRVLFKDNAKQTTQSITDASHTHTITYQEEISGVLNALRKTFNTPPPADGRYHGYRLVTNDTCAFHVHVGNDSTGFSLPTVKNLLSISAAFERVIDEMHTALRIGGSTLALTPLNGFSLDAEDTNDMAGVGSMTSGVFNKALTERLMSNAYVTRRNDTHTPNLKEDRELYPGYPAGRMESDPVLKQAASGFHTMAFVDVIQEAPDIKSLREMLSSCSETNVSINHLIAGDRDEMISEERQYKRFNTVEFRQHTAVMTAGEALPWVDLVQAMVKYADKQSTKDIRSVCERAATDPSFDLPALLELLDVERETRDYYLNRSNETIQHPIDAARVQVEGFVVADPFREISLDLLNERAEDHDLDNVSEVIRKKFEKGGYGQFSRDFIDRYASQLDDKIKDKLEIGWNAPLRDDSGEEMSMFDSMGLLDDL
jgi:hypothetical protein